MFPAIPIKADLSKGYLDLTLMYTKQLVTKCDEVIVTCAFLVLDAAVASLLSDAG